MWAYRRSGTLASFAPRAVSSRLACNGCWASSPLADRAANANRRTRKRVRRIGGCPRRLARALGTGSADDNDRLSAGQVLVEDLSVISAGCADVLDRGQLFHGSMVINPFTDLLPI